MIRVAIVAASELERAGLAALLTTDPEIFVAGSAGSIDSALLPAAFDVLLAAGEGLVDEALFRSTAQFPIVLVLPDPDARTLARVLRAGIRGVASLQSGPAELASAVRAVYHGWCVAPAAELASALPPERTAESVAEQLTPRELDVLRMLADGLGNKQIAFQLGISEHTVKFHVNAILQKLNAATRTEAVMVGLRSGLILL